MWRGVRRLASRCLLLGGSPRALQPRLLALADQAPEQLAALPHASPTLEALRAFARLETERCELEKQRAAEVEVEVQQLYDGELVAADARLMASAQQLEEELLLLLDHDQARTAALDSRDAILELTPGVGGQEAALFAAEMLEMYQRLADTKGWRFEVQQLTEGMNGALHACTARIATPFGLGAFGFLKCESGVHRVQRIPTTERKGRMQTSSAVVVVLPVAVEQDIALPAGDLRVEVSKKSSGPGGQSVNSAHQAIRIVHLPTGMSVTSSSSSSQLENRKKALEMLRTRLLRQEMSSWAEFENRERKEQKGTGDRSEKIRTFNFQRDDFADHVLGKDSGVMPSASDVLFGDGLEKILEAHQKRGREERVLSALDMVQAYVSSSG